MSIDQYPDPLHSDIVTAIEVLKGLGAGDVYLFGAILSSTDPSSVGDLDLAVAGLTPEQHVRAYASLSKILQCPFDLVDLDTETAFVRALRADGRLQRVA